MPFTVPVIDLAAASPADLVSPLSASSCAFIVNHGVDERLLAEMIAVSTQFFDLPRAEKLKTRWPGTGLWSGWQPVHEGHADLTGGRTPDLLERFEVALSGRRASDPAALAALESTFSLWPSSPASFASVWTRYYAALGTLANRITELIVAALDLPRDVAAGWTDEHYANLVAINYIEQPQPPEPGQLRIQAHTDRGGMTILWADDSPGGLEVLVPAQAREWVPVTIPPGAFLVQVGDLLTRWTGRAIRPNIHRVVNPPREVAATSRRLSIPYFHYPRLDLIVETAPSCLRPGARAPRPVTAFDHTFKRQEDYAGDYGVGEELASVVEDAATGGGRSIQ